MAFLAVEGCARVKWPQQSLIGEFEEGVSDLRCALHEPSCICSQCTEGDAQCTEAHCKACLRSGGQCCNGQSYSYTFEKQVPGPRHAWLMKQATLQSFETKFMEASNPRNWQHDNPRLFADINTKRGNGETMMSIARRKHAGVSVGLCDPVYTRSQPAESS